MMKTEYKKIRVKEKRNKTVKRKATILPPN